MLTVLEVRRDLRRKTIPCPLKHRDRVRQLQHGSTSKMTMKRTRQIWISRAERERLRLQGNIMRASDAHGTFFRGGMQALDTNNKLQLNAHHAVIEVEDVIRTSTSSPCESLESTLCGKAQAKLFSYGDMLVACEQNAPNAVPRRMNEALTVNSRGTNAHRVQFVLPSSSGRYLCLHVNIRGTTPRHRMVCTATAGTTAIADVRKAQFRVATEEEEGPPNNDMTGKNTRSPST